MKKFKTLVVFISAAALSLLAAGYRFQDSAHSIGLINNKGGMVRHAAHFEGGKDHYVLIATATVLPPYRGDARVVLEGDPAMRYEIYDSRPVFDLGLHRHPSFEGNTLQDLQPKDRLALWVVMRPEAASTSSIEALLPPAGGSKAEDSCCPVPEGSGPVAADVHSQPSSADGKLALTFYDTRTNKQVLRIPIIFSNEDSAVDEQ